MKNLIVVVLASVAVAAAWAAAGNRPGGRFQRQDDLSLAAPAPVQPGPSVDTHLTGETKLVADDGASMDGFGSSVSLDGDTVLVGAQFNAAAGTASGAAYVFRRDDTGWSQETKLLPGDAAPFDFFGILGLLSLAGIIINNGIVLIDRIDIERDAGREPYPAIVEATVSRFRPICMTTITTILGVMPLILSRDPVFYSLALIIASGLAFGTVLTLGVVPILYAVLFNVKKPATA